MVKLGILRRYARVFASKVGSRVMNGRVCYFDGFAGQGFYNDGTPGSPGTAAGVGDVISRSRVLDGYLVERDRRLHAALLEAASEGDWGWRVERGEATDHVDSMLEWGEADPLLAFVDPFGLGLPFDDLRRISERRPCKTELLLNVSKAGIRRVCGHKTGEEHRAKAGMIRSADEKLGGDWWHDRWDRSRADASALEIAEEFARFLGRELDYAIFMAPMQDRLDGPVDYLLVLATTHRDGLWFFNECVSLTLEEYRRAAAEAAGEFFFEDEDVHIQAIRANIEHLLDEGDSFRPRDRIKAVYGSQLARTVQ